MKWFQYSLAFLLPLLLVKTPFAVCEDPDASKPAIKVNGEIITYSELDAVVRRQPAFSFYSKMGNSNPAMMNDFRWNEIQNIIGQKVLSQEIAKSMAVTPEEVAKLVDAKIEAEFGGKERLKALIDALHGDMASFSKELSSQALMSLYGERVLLSEIKVTEDEVEKALQQNPRMYEGKPTVHARHILIKAKPPNPDGTESPDEKKKIDEIYAKAIAPNSDFVALAKEFSQCPSASKGGDFGSFEPGRMVPEFDVAAFLLKVGEVSHPIKTRFGYHIIKVEGRTEPSSTASHDKARANLIHARLAVKLKEKVEELRKAAQIEILLPPRSAPPPTQALQPVQTAK